jgi:hypothetical protein
VRNCLVRALGPPMTALSVMTLCAGLSACGGNGTKNSLRSATSAGYVLGDADDDDRHSGAEPTDRDDAPVRHYGAAGTAGDMNTMAVVLKRFYAAAAAGDGARACGLLSAKLAHGHRLERFVPEEYRPTQGATIFQGRGCAKVESTLFSIDREQLRAQSTSMLLPEVRVRGRHAIAIVRFKHFPERQIALKLEDNGWKVDALMDSLVP